MAVRLDIELTESEKAAMAAIPSTSWFTQFIYRNAESPVHPNRKLAENNEMKQAMVSDWVTESVKGKRVLDLFSANGGFSIMAALAGAKEVVGVEFSEERIKCAQFIASTLKSDCKIEFIHGDVYQIENYFDEPFDVVLCLGGLYHIADPAFVLRQIGGLTKERLLMQTSQVLPIPGNWAKFIVRRQDKTQGGMTSIRGGYGTWFYSPGCLRELLLHGGFDIVEERQPSILKRQRFPWFFASCEPLT
ncbi:class I SAM-dependent methyltransferase [Methylotuvimicrobium buryatense]|nr:methyltransferase domain-containing protein [Methylotuvimicrobium buryatense]